MSIINAEHFNVNNKYIKYNYGKRNYLFNRPQYGYISRW